MAKGITLNILANVRDFLRGTKDMEAALDDVADALDDVGDEGQDTADKVEKSFRDLTRAAHTTGDKVGKDLKHGFKEGAEGAENFKEEAQQEIRETASSFGSVEDALDGIQSLAANALVGFGPAGVVAGAAAALALGTFFEGLTADSEAAQDRIRAMYDDMIESGRNFVSDAARERMIADIIADPAKLQEAKVIVDQTGIRIQDVLQGIAGDQEQINAIVIATNKARDDEIAKINGSNLSSKDRLAAIDEANRAYDHTIEKLQGVGSETQTAVDNAALYRSTVEKANDQLDKANEKTRELQKQSELKLKVTADTSEAEQRIAALKRANELVIEVSARQSGGRGRQVI